MRGGQPRPAAPPVTDESFPGRMIPGSNPSARTATGSESPADGNRPQQREIRTAWAAVADQDFRKFPSPVRTEARPPFTSFQEVELWLAAPELHRGFATKALLA